MDELTVEKLAEVLHEPNVPLVRQVLRTLGLDRTVAVLTDTLTCEANGGMRTKAGDRRRTPGGVFFQIARERATARERRRLFPRPASQTHQAQTPTLTWDEVQTITQRLKTVPAGEARTMKLTLIARPGKVETRGDAVVFRLQGKPPGSLPRGLPPVSPTPGMTWTVMVARRQWSRVRESLATNTEDLLVLEGYPLLRGTEHVLLVQSCTSVALQRAQKQAQQHHQAETPA